MKDEIALTESQNEPLDAILLGYGICSSGTVGVTSSRYRIVIPRAHDCITLFLGSKERYLEEFSKAPGTYWFTPGFISGNIQPGMSEKYAGVYHQFENNFEQYLERFGEEDIARYIIEHQEQAWIKNYTRGAYVASGLPGGEALRDKACRFCESRGWAFEEVKGEMGLLRDLFSGNWDSGRFLVLEPGEKLALGGIDDVVTAQGEDEKNTYAGEDYRKSFVYDGDYREITPGAPVNLNVNIDNVIGIDAGGTYTDAVIVSLRNNKVLAVSKSPTTHHNLSIGIKNAILQLPDTLLRNSSRLAISTTLATNSIVEERGGRTGLILVGYTANIADMVTIGIGDMKIIVRGRHDIYGNKIEPLDEKSLVSHAELMLKNGVEALAV
ncbi:MAG: DUF1638 domain-containing protein, partial [Candidatus Latescibacteria bacterium]|nr:DUF1638 domain-containing protein [Candidatus Latescibacterota bacterium]